MTKRLILALLTLTLLVPLSAAAEVTPYDPSSGIPLPFGGARQSSARSSASVPNASLSSSSHITASHRSTRVALRQLRGYEAQSQDQKINRTLRDVIAHTNAERKRSGLSPVSQDADLSAFAQAFARDMADQDYFSHETPEGLDFEARFKNSLYFQALSDCHGCRLSVSAAENIAKGQTKASEVVQDWIDSPEHYANIIDPDLTHIGVGRQGKYWVQVFVGTQAK